MLKLTFFIQLITKGLKLINTICISVATYLTLFFVDFKTMKEGLIISVDFFQLKYLIASIIAGLIVLWIYYSIKVYIKQIIKESIEKVDDSYKKYSESFSSFFIYDSIINTIVDKKIIKNMSEEELANILSEGKFLIKDLTRFGFNKEVIKRVIRKYHEGEIKKLNNESNRNNEQVSERT